MVIVFGRLAKAAAFGRLAAESLHDADAAKRLLQQIVKRFVDDAADQGFLKEIKDVLEQDGQDDQTEYQSQGAEAADREKPVDEPLGDLMVVELVAGRLQLAFRVRHLFGKPGKLTVV